MINLQGKINKLLTAIRLNGIDIKIDTIQFYSETTEKYCNNYKVYIKKWTRDKYGNRVLKYVFQDEFMTKVELLKYLIYKYDEIQQEKKEGEANG